MKTSNASDIFQVNIKLINRCAESIRAHTHFSRGVFPDTLKDAKAISFHKKRFHNRSLKLSAYLIKIISNALYIRVSNFLENFQIITPAQEIYQHSFI